MQYLLTEEEYNKLKQTQELDLKLKKDGLQKLCTKIANTMLVDEGWYKGKPWGCILTHDDWYCDSCPVAGICPHPSKKWSK
jgi:hypothetical protein